jgi:hypothetical protein
VVRYRENPQRSSDICRRWREKNPDYAEINRERINSHSRAYRRSNKRAYAAHRAAARARKANATPGWFSEFDDLVIREAYELAKKRGEVTGLPWEVDHIIPIAGVNVCGLHVAGNIQVIPRFLNRRKSNHFEVSTEEIA